MIVGIFHIYEVLQRGVGKDGGVGRPWTHLLPLIHVSMDPDERDTLPLVTDEEYLPYPGYHYMPSLTKSIVS